MHSVRPGYTGGKSRFVTYYTLGDHKEAIQIDFDPRVLSFDRLLSAFWSHNRPGSAGCDQLGLWWHTEAQREAIELSVAERGRTDVSVGPAAEFHKAMTLSSLCLRAITPGLRALERPSPSAR